MDCCKSIERFTNSLSDNFGRGAFITAISSGVGAACGASGALVGVAAATGALYGVTIGVVYYVTVSVVEQFTNKEIVQAVVAAALATIAGIFLMPAVLGAKVSVAAALLMSSATVAAIFACVLLIETATTVIDECLRSEK